MIEIMTMEIPYIYNSMQRQINDQNLICTDKGCMTDYAHGSVCRGSSIC